jgi:hypothetical protein
MKQMFRVVSVVIAATALFSVWNQGASCQAG